MKGKLLQSWQSLAVLLGTALLLWFVTAVTMEGVFAKRRPELALAVRGSSAEANARSASKTFYAALSSQNKASPEALASIRAQAEAALMREPVNVTAARTLAGVAAAANEGPKAERLIRYAESLSRRDLLTQLWLIESAVRSDDVRLALKHYDRALRTSRRSHDLLFPVLTAAADQPNVREPLITILSQRPPWWRRFIRHVVDEGRNPQTMHALAVAVGLPQAPEEESLLRTAIRRLARLQDYRGAYDLYLRAQKDASVAGRLIRNGGFEERGGLEPFDWTLSTEPDLSAMRQPRPGGSGDALFITAQNGRGGDVASQLLLLRPGNYSLRAMVGSIGGDASAHPQVVLQCASNNSEILRETLPEAPEPGSRWQQTFSVPADCPVQTLILRGRSSEDPSPAAPWVDDIGIVPL